MVTGQMSMHTSSRVYHVYIGMHVQLPYKFVSARQAYIYSYRHVHVHLSLALSLSLFLALYIHILVHICIATYMQKDRRTDIASSLSPHHYIFTPADWHTYIHTCTPGDWPIYINTCTCSLWQAYTQLQKNIVYHLTDRPVGSSAIKYPNIR